MTDPPTTPGLPLVGNALNVLLDPVNYFVDAVAEHGPVFRGVVMGRPIYFVTGTRGRHLFDREQQGGCPLSRSGMFGVFATETFVDLFGLDGDEHDALRKLLQLGYSRIVAAQFVPEMVAATRQRVRQWMPGARVSLLDAAGELAVRAVTLALSPEDLEPLVRAASVTGNRVMNVIMGTAPQSALKLPGYQADRDLMIEVLDRAVASHKSGAHADDGRNWMIDAWQGSRDSDGEGLNDVAVRGAAMYSLSGTHVYLSRSIAFVVYHLLRDRALLDRIEDEVDAAMAQGEPNAATLRRLPLLRASIREALRLYPPVPAISMKTTRDIEVAGCSVPGGSAIAFSSIPDHYNPEFFDHPFDFDPERWFPERRRPRPPGSYGPFGLKSQTCAATGLVEVVTMSVLLGLLYEARMYLPKASYRPRLMLNPLLGPVGGMPVEFTGLRDDGARRIRPEALQDLELEEWTDGGGLEADDLDFSAIQVAIGDVIVQQGAVAEAFYVIVEGRADVVVEDEDGETTVAELGPGQSFGEVGLFKSAPRNATVRASTPGTLLTLDRAAFEALVAGSDLIGPELGMVLYRRYIDNALRKSLPGLARRLKESGLEDFDVRAAQPGDVILRQGDAPDAFYVLAVGRAEVHALDRRGDLRKLADLGPGTGFGEMGLLENRPRSATVIISGHAPATLLRMERDRFLELVESSPDSLKDLSALARTRLMSNLDSIYGD